MNILLIGSGGREHALAWKMSQSPLLRQLYIAPGNGGTAVEGIHVPLNVTDHRQTSDFCKEKEVDLVVIGPEQPLVDGLADHLRARGIRVIGPSASGARLEGSKTFAKAFMSRHKIPTAQYATFDQQQITAARQYVQGMSLPLVLKADGLAAGKGVLICQTRAEALTEVEKMLNGKFGDASKTVVIEEFLSGMEFSVFVLTDGKSYVLLPTAKDYKRISEGDRGLNTGGMGTVSPVPFVDDALMEKVENDIILPTIEGLSSENIPYVGFLFFGLINVQGRPYVIEYNCRLGDPETQVILPRLDGDIVRLFGDVAQGQLSGDSIQILDEYVVSVILASGGYPLDYEKGKTLDISAESGDLIFHAGTKVKDGALITDGGRVLSVCGRAKTLEGAIASAYQLVEKINFEGKYFRKDIGQDLLKYVQS